MEGVNLYMIWGYFGLCLLCFWVVGGGERVEGPWLM